MKVVSTAAHCELTSAFGGAMLMGVVAVVFLGTCGHWRRSLRMLGRPWSPVIPAFQEITAMPKGRHFPTSLCVP